MIFDILSVLFPWPSLTGAVDKKKRSQLPTGSRNVAITGSPAGGKCAGAGMRRSVKPAPAGQHLCYFLMPAPCCERHAGRGNSVKPRGGDMRTCRGQSPNCWTEPESASSKPGITGGRPPIAPVSCPSCPTSLSGRKTQAPAGLSGEIAPVSDLKAVKILTALTGGLSAASFGSLVPAVLASLPNAGKSRPEH